MIYTRYILKAIALYLCIIELNYAEINFNDIDSIKNWNILQNKKIQIKWVNHSDFPICQTSSTLPFSMKSISNIIEDVENYYNANLTMKYKEPEKVLVREIRVGSQELADSLFLELEYGVDFVELALLPR
mgnify:CR=1 FL=1